MWTERDQIQAYQFLRRRLVSALTLADANHAASPSRRLVFGTVLGAAAALVTTAGFGAFGLLQPADAAGWKQTGQVILEAGSGGHFVLGKDGLLHPVVNQSSALLLAGSTKTVTVSAAALRTVPRGAPLGIPGAPVTVPSAHELITPALVSCSDGTSDPSRAAPVPVLLLSRAGDRTSAMSGMSGVAEGHGLPVQSPEGDRYLISGGLRYRLPDQASVIALGYQDAAPLKVSATWLDALPAGRDLGLVAVQNAGANGPDVGGAGTRAGQVLSATDPVSKAIGYYLVRPAGLEPISQTEAALVVNNTANNAAYHGTTPAIRQVSVADVAASPQVPAGDDASGYPARVPAPVTVGNGGVVVCAAGTGQTGTTVAIGSALPLPSAAPTVPTGAKEGGKAAEQVYVPPGYGALVTAQAAPGAPAGASYLVTDTGTKYPLADAAARKALGYGGVTATAVPQALLGLLPTGPALDPAAAQNTIATGSDR